MRELTGSGGTRKRLRGCYDTTVRRVLTTVTVIVGFHIKISLLSASHRWPETQLLPSTAAKRRLFTSRGVVKETVLFYDALPMNAKNKKTEQQPGAVGFHHSDDSPVHVFVPW